MAHLKITFWNYFFDRVAQLLASKGSKKHLLGHISSFECCNFAKKNWCLPGSYRIFVITGAQWSSGGKCTFFFENDLFDPGIGYFTPQISLNKTENHFSHYPRSQVDINSYTRLKIAMSLIAGQGCRARLPGKAALQGCMQWCNMLEAW
jgi:hypothetical protein